MRTAAPERNWAAKQVRRALGAGDDVVGLGRESHRMQVLGHLGRAAGRVVGDVQGASTRRSRGSRPHPSVGSCPRNTVPSRSSSRQSCSCTSALTSAQLRDPVFGVGHSLDIGGRGVDEPLQRLIVRGRAPAAFRRRRRTAARPSGRFASDPVAASTECARACSCCPRSDRAPATTMRNSSASSPVSWAASGLRASSIARSGRPTPRSQSAISGSSGDLLPIRRAARSSASAWAQSPQW